MNEPSSRRSVGERDNAEPARIQRSPDRRRSGPTGPNRDFSMDGGRDQAQSEQFLE